MSITIQQHLEQSVNVSHQKCALVVHGLNSKPSKMNALADLLRKNDIQTDLGILSGHTGNKEQDENISKKIWETEFKQQWHNSTKKCSTEADVKILVGYSLGALVALHSFDTLETKPLPTKMILLAPALSLRSYVNALRLFSWLPWLKIPSLNHSDYRAQDYTPMKSYNTLFQIHQEWQKNGFKNTDRISTIIALSSRDELINSKEIEEKVNQMDSKNWKVLWLNNDESSLRPQYHHLIIDKESLGDTSWNKLTEEIINHIK